ncbi:cytochrome c oxidase accessory protein CcoG [Corticibacter populi]|uniref:Cytochrome c oxidase accessory protein CcoG n=1 Tax=Corticibacter populi TaxID=1550736 RepID=A0A3M6R0L4_9BURK|nr:cytochrome c oxidase accessory protein CcoG [Corticibacter populi]RMX08787.1 cytochrome c oxidase accessory protein CcoG [Corticibacter populi]RZS36147.1 cytochrome c oxidase accessory protein FixG [Corticibacter populi]
MPTPDTKDNSQPASTDAGTPRKVIPIASAPAGDGDKLISMYEKHQKVYPRMVQGIFNRWRWLMVLATQLFFYGMPWLQWGDRQMLLFDLGARRFYIFGLVLYPQDFIYLTGLLVISALSLFLFTAVAGRLWCGFSCPQTVYSEIFLWIERRVEGERGARMKLDAQGMSLHKFGRKFLKHFIWIALSLWTGFTFVGYFTPIRELGADFLQGHWGSWGLFWMLFYGFATYGNAGFLREQVCKYMCPYARFQSAMFDPDTMIVSYNTARGEPRGKRVKNVDKASSGQGDCIDCQLCVQVCPTGIDIRNGLQYECIGCGLCIDACNSIMDRMHYPRGLISLTTQNALAGNWPPGQAVRRMFRPRVLVYSAILLALIIGMLATMTLRTPFKVDVVRDRATLARIVDDQLENVYRLQIMNAQEVGHTYRISARGIDGLQVIPATAITVDAAQARWIVLQLQAPYEAAMALGAGSHKIVFDIQNLESGKHLEESSVFIVPR